MLYFLLGFSSMLNIVFLIQYFKGFKKVRDMYDINSVLEDKESFFDFYGKISK